ncbi:MAG: hypothetical protein JWL69_2291 [Phycisphaerales bacterium]|nr:hypothetical protein [Phycisphaerales bacterium]
MVAGGSWRYAGGMVDQPSFDALGLAIREVLLRDWDPHNAARMPEASGTYDGYVEPLAAMIRGGAGEDAVVEWLHERERETMCFPSLGTGRLVRVAQKLVALARLSR